MEERLGQLWEDLRALHRRLRERTHEKHRRINPFYEDLFDWKERGAYWAGAGKNITIYNSTTVAGDVEIGDDTWIGPFCSLDGSGKLKIGRYCSISLGCQLLTHDTARWALSGGKAAYEYAPTSVGDYCFLGSYAVICKGVVVGKRCLIAAGAVVTNDVPDGTIAAGVPARRIGTVEVAPAGEVSLVYDDQPAELR